MDRRRTRGRRKRVSLRYGFFQELQANLSTTLLGPSSAVCRFKLDQIESLTSLFLRYLPERWTFSIWIFLLGEMGSGKTTFVRALAEQLGVSNVRSPTFSLLHLHETPRGVLSHFDLFRLQEPSERRHSLEDFLFTPGLKCIEWPTDALFSLWQKKALTLRWSVLDQSTRSLQIDSGKTCTT